jgi:hypothetical protein
MSSSSVVWLADVERNWVGPTLSTLAERIRAVKVRRELKNSGSASEWIGSCEAGQWNSCWGETANEVESGTGRSRRRKPAVETTQTAGFRLRLGTVPSTLSNQSTDDRQGPKS